MTGAANEVRLPARRRGAGHGGAAGVRGAEHSSGRGGVLGDPLLAAAAGDGDDVGSLGEQPGQGELARRQPEPGGQLTQRRDLAEVALQGLAVKPRVLTAEITGVDVGPGQGGGEQAAAERAVGHQADAQPPAAGTTSSSGSRQSSDHSN